MNKKNILTIVKIKNSNLVFAYIIFNNFKLSPDFDWTIATDSAVSFSGKAMQDLTLRPLVA